MFIIILIINFYNIKYYLFFSNIFLHHNFGKMHLITIYLIFKQITKVAVGISVFFKKYVSRNWNDNAYHSTFIDINLKEFQLLVKKFWFYFNLNLNTFSFIEKGKCVSNFFYSSNYYKFVEGSYNCLVAWNVKDKYKISLSTIKYF